MGEELMPSMGLKFDFKFRFGFLFGFGVEFRLYLMV